MIFTGKYGSADIEVVMIEVVVLAETIALMLKDWEAIHVELDYVTNMGV